jgi:hypothetical protein
MILFEYLPLAEASAAAQQIVKQFQPLVCIMRAPRNRPYSSTAIVEMHLSLTQSIQLFSFE